MKLSRDVTMVILKKNMVVAVMQNQIELNKNHAEVNFVSIFKAVGLSYDDSSVIAPNSDHILMKVTVEVLKWKKILKSNLLSLSSQPHL